MLVVEQPSVDLVGSGDLLGRSLRVIGKAGIASVVRVDDHAVLSGQLAQTGDDPVGVLAVGNDDQSFFFEGFDRGAEVRLLMGRHAASLRP
jgi:hypothetical protein